MIIKAPAKVNLCLNITGRREDGYHELETIMQTIDLYDYVTICPAESFSFICSDPALSNDNLVVKAASTFYSAFNRPAGVSIKLEKNIPYGAGLGGGSSDAAATLTGLNRLYGEPFSRAELWRMARSLGADVPFFLVGGTALCTGIGDIVEPCPDFPLCNYVLVKPEVNLSTAQVYASIDIEALQFRKRLSTIQISPSSQSVVKAILYNDLEPAALAMCPDLIRIRETLYARGAGGVLLSGSGSTMFGLFADKRSSEKAAEQLSMRQLDKWWVKPCQGINTDFK